MAQILKERARTPLAESVAVNGSQCSFQGGLGYSIDVYQSHPKHNYSVRLTREEMLKVVSSWLAGEARMAADEAKKAAR